MAGLVRDFSVEYPYQGGIDFDALYNQSGLNNNNLNNNNQSWLEKNAKGLAAIGMGVQGLSGLANAYMGYKNYQLAQEQFKFQKGLARRNLANQAKIINNTYDNAAQVAAGMIGGKDNFGNYGFTNQDVVDRYSNAAKDKHVSGTI